MGLRSVTLLLSITWFTAVVSATDAGKIEMPLYALSEDPKAPVITLQYRGGRTPPRVNDEPELLVQANGTVILGDPFGKKKRIESKISRQQIQDLLRFIFDEQNLDQFNAPQVDQQIKAARVVKGHASVNADALTTIVRVHAGGKEVEAKFYALRRVAREYPEIKPLAQLLAVQERLERLRTVINAGGDEEIAKHVTLANAVLKGESPGVPPLGASHLKHAWLTANGDRYVRFMRQEKLASDKTRFTRVQINYPISGEPKVTTNVNLIVRD